MGGSNSRVVNNPDLVLEQTDFDVIQSQSAFSPGEIRALFERFKGLGGTKKKSVEMRQVIMLPEFAFNPFNGRIAQVFGDYDDTKAGPMAAQEEKKITNVYALVEESKNVNNFTCSFPQFCHMMHVFSIRATFAEKARYAYRIYDFTNDDIIDSLDVQCIIVTAMGATALSVKNLQAVASDIMNEADLDGNKKLEEVEFTRIVKRIPEFMSRFSFQVQFT